VNNGTDVAALVYRDPIIEAVHYATVAVLDGKGRLTHYLGNPDVQYMTRSVVKPFQAMALLMAGGFERFGFSPKQLAVMCASHTGSDEHRELVMSNLAQAGNSPNDLKCGMHWPIGMRQDEQYPLNGEDKDVLRHNCSGKHSGFLALARHLGEDVSKYLDPDSRTQQLVRAAVAEMCEYQIERATVGIDGCSAPVFSIPIRNLALGFKKLASGEGNTPTLAEASSLVSDAMRAHPLMVSGEKRLDYDLMRSFPGNVVCKIGAEAIEGIGFADPPLGITVKIIDGNQRALGPVIVEALKQLGLIKNIDEFPFLKPHERPVIRNYRGLATGKIVAQFRLKEV